MSEHELGKLLGGFAADTLTADEKQRLYAAAIQDQQLFNALADEQALKELLADPGVRQRLLQALNQSTSSGAGSLSWLEWFRRPAGLAWAGGMAAAALAIVLGTRIYQDSVKQAAQSVATEETRTSAPRSAAVPAPEAKTNEPPAKDLTKHDTLPDKKAKRERAAPPMPQAKQAVDAVRDLDSRRGRDEARAQADTPSDDSSQTAERISSSAEKKLAASPPAPAPAMTPSQAPTEIAAGGVAAPAISARALFYGEAAARLDPDLSAQKKGRSMKPPAESQPQAEHLERRYEQFSQMERAKSAVTTAKPLGLRYGLVSRGSDGREREVDAATVGKNRGLTQLTIESNQDAYLQVWITVGSSATFLLWPDKDTGQISVKIAAGQRQLISLPEATDPMTLTARLSRVPFGPITRQEATLLDRPAHGQLQEWVPEDRATYVVLPDSSPQAKLLATLSLSK